VAWQRSRAIAKQVVLPISALLTRIRKLIPHHQDCHYDEIVRGSLGRRFNPSSGV
jgi:hypothetical protein